MQDALDDYGEEDRYGDTCPNCGMAFSAVWPAVDVDEMDECPHCFKPLRKREHDDDDKG